MVEYAAWIRKCRADFISRRNVDAPNSTPTSDLGTHFVQNLLSHLAEIVYKWTDSRQTLTSVLGRQGNQSLGA